MRHTLGDVEVRFFGRLREGLGLFDIEFIGGSAFRANTGKLGHDVGENRKFGRVWIHGYCYYSGIEIRDLCSEIGKGALRFLS